MTQYPEAQAKYTHFNNLATELKTCKDKIPESVSLTVTHDTNGFKGDYYNKYVEAEERWRQEVNSIADKFNAFRGELDSCIANAESKAEWWRVRIGE